MKVTVYTCDRDPSYLEETVQSIPPEMEAEIVWQKENPRVPIKHSSILLHTPKPYLQVGHNSRLNYGLALLYSTDGLIIEDDVILSTNFIRYLNTAKKLIPCDRYVLSLYSCYKWKFEEKFQLVHYPTELFYGSQAMYYDAVTKREMAAWVLDGLIMETEPHDFAVRAYCKEFDIPLFTLNYSLVQHIGEVTTGLGYHHQCINFIDDFSEENIFPE